MKDQPSTSGDHEEPVRPRSIPDDFIWDLKYQAWFAPGEPSTWDPEEWLREFNNREKEDHGKRLITVDEMRAAGALDVPAAWRKSLGGEPDRQRDLFSGLLEDDDASPE